MSLFVNAYQNNDEKTTLTDLLDWISTNSKSYTIDDVLEKVMDNMNIVNIGDFLDSSSEFQRVEISFYDSYRW